MTTNEKLALEVQKAIIGHPAKGLHNSISIIDTPGTDSLEKWHEEVTKIAIMEISDASNILSSAEKSLPKS